MKTILEKGEIARSLELYQLQQHLKQKATLDQIVLEFVREPFLRKKSEVGKVVIAFGSYDPLTKAHESLFLRGLDAVKDLPARTNLSELLIATSVVHFEKAVNLQKNSAIYDRIHAQEKFASCYGNVSLALFNDPYFVNLVNSCEQQYGHDVSLNFVVGTDVMEKIVDPEGYRIRGFDVNAVLPKLFKHRFIVAERSIKTKDHDKQIVTLEDLKKIYPALKQYESQLIPINLEGKYKGLEIPIQEVSSTLVRKRRNDRKPVSNLEAAGISDFVDRRGIYLQNDAKYAAFCYARQRFVDEHPNQPIATYLDELVTHLAELDRKPSLRAKEINDYCGPKRKKVLVINPPNEPFTDKSLLIEPIDMLTIATYIKSIGNDVKFVDMDGTEQAPDSISKTVAEFKPDITVLGFDYQIPLFRSSAIPGLNRISDIAKSFGSKVVVGGRRSKHNPEWFIDGSTDVAIGSEMELPLLNLLNLEYWFPETLRNINGIAYRTKTGFMSTSERKTKIDVNTLPIPDRSLIDTSNYIDVRTMWTSRGCNGTCRFCGTPDFWGSWRGRDANKVVDEIEYLVNDFKANKILFLDDNATVNKHRMNDICDGINEKEIESTFGCLSRVSSYEKKLMTKMYNAGFRWIHYGGESGSQEVLNRCKKGTTPNQIRDAILGSKENGLRVRTSWIFDLPDIDAKAMQETIDLILETQPHEIRAHYLALRKGTNFYDEFSKKGESQSQYIHNEKPLSRSSSFTSDMIVDQVNNLTHELAKKGYLVITKPDELNHPAVLNDPNVKFISFCPTRYGIGWQR